MRQRHDGRAAVGLVQQRQFAEEIARSEAQLAVRTSASTSPETMKYIARAGAPLTAMMPPRATDLRPQQVQDFAQDPRVESP